MSWVIIVKVLAVGAVAFTAMDITLLFKGAMNFYSNEEKALRG